MAQHDSRQHEGNRVLGHQTVFVNVVQSRVIGPLYGLLSPRTWSQQAWHNTIATSMMVLTSELPFDCPKTAAWPAQHPHVIKHAQHAAVLLAKHTPDYIRTINRLSACSRQCGSDFRPLWVARHSDEDVWLLAMAHDSQRILVALSPVTRPASKGGWQHDGYPNITSSQRVSRHVTQADCILYTLVAIGTDISLVGGDLMQAMALGRTVQVHLSRPT